MSRVAGIPRPGPGGFEDGKLSVASMTLWRVRSGSGPTLSETIRRLVNQIESPSSAVCFYLYFTSHITDIQSHGHLPTDLISLGVHIVEANMAHRFQGSNAGIRIHLQLLQNVFPPTEREFDAKNWIKLLFVDLNIDARRW